MRTKEIVQRVSGHEGVVCWVDTCPGASGTIVSGGLDGTVRIWVDVNEEDEVIDGLEIKQENRKSGFDHDDDDDDDDEVAMDGVQVENDHSGHDNDTLGDHGINGEQTPARSSDEDPLPDKMEED